MALQNNNVKTSIFDVDQETGFYAEGIPSMDLKHGGQWGFLPEIGAKVDGRLVHAWMYNQSYMRMDVIPIVLQTPRMFDLFPNSQDWHAAVKALFEVHAKSIDGLNSSLSADVNSKDMGLSGATLKEVTKVTREETSVSLTVDEKYGVPIEILLDVWLRYGHEDPDTRSPLANALLGEDAPDIWGIEWKTATVLFIEPDPLLRKPIHAWLVSNLFPQQVPDIIGKKNKMDSREVKEMTIEMGGLALPSTNKNVMELASTILSNLKLYNKTPDDILIPADKVDAILESFKDENVYYQGVQQ